MLSEPILSDARPLAGGALRLGTDQVAGVTGGGAAVITVGIERSGPCAEALEVTADPTEMPFAPSPPESPRAAYGGIASSTGNRGCGGRGGCCTAGGGTTAFDEARGGTIGGGRTLVKVRRSPVGSGVPLARATTLWSVGTSLYADGGAGAGGCRPGVYVG